MFANKARASQRFAIIIAQVKEIMFEFAVLFCFRRYKKEEKERKGKKEKASLILISATLLCCDKRFKKKGVLIIVMNWRQKSTGEFFVGGGAILCIRELHILRLRRGAHIFLRHFPKTQWGLLPSILILFLKTGVHPMS